MPSGMPFLSCPWTGCLWKLMRPTLPPRGFHLPRTNVPQNITYVVETLASYMHVTAEELRLHALENTEKLFHIGKNGGK